MHNLWWTCPHGNLYGSLTKSKTIPFTSRLDTTVLSPPIAKFAIGIGSVLSLGNKETTGDKSYNQPFVMAGKRETRQLVATQTIIPLGWRQKNLYYLLFILILTY